MKEVTKLQTTYGAYIGISHSRTVFKRPRQRGCHKAMYSTELAKEGMTLKYKYMESLVYLYMDGMNLLPQ